MTDAREFVQSIVGEGEGEVTVELSPLEEGILALHERVQQQQLELRLLETQPESEDASGNLDEAAREAVEAKAQLTVKMRIVEGVVSVNALLDAVHNWGDSTVQQRNLKSLVHKRDALSMYHTNVFLELKRASDALSSKENDMKHVTSENQMLVQELLRLTEEQVEDVRDERIKAQLADVDDESRKLKRKWTTMKSVVGAIIGGSGVDWAHDEELIELVKEGAERNV